MTSSSSHKKKVPVKKKGSIAAVADKSVIQSSNLFPVVGIGASAGGLDAFKKFLKAIPGDSGMAYVLVQHLDPKHESLLTELLQKVTPIPVIEISDDLKVKPDHIYIIPSNKMLIANDGVLELSPRPGKTGTERNMPIDLFFTSLAEVHQSHAIGVVLSGTASDGTLGLKAIKDHGGITFAQDEESAAYEGMPHSAVQAGVVDFILPPGEIPQKLAELVGRIILSDEELHNIPLQEEEIFKQILTLLRLRKGTDFTYYKQTTIRRRKLRRMAINKNENAASYLNYLRENKPEQDLLYQDLLIPVTDFFRDPKIFDSLCKTIFPVILENKTAIETIRIWIAGCSTGEEVYSIAICLQELLNEIPAGSGYRGESPHRVQIFATDISEPAIAKARAAVYSKTDIKGLTEKKLKEFFTKSNDTYQANKSIRDMCVFAVHNFLKDPPFSKIDLISCRNVLIYMEPYLQKKALTTFHYALNANGFLLLGKSETTSGVPELFASHNKKDKLFTRKDVPGSFIHTTTQRKEESFAAINVKGKKEVIQTDFQKTADDIMLSKYTPAGVVINEAMDIVHFRGSTGNYLEPSPGKASLNLLKMAKEGLAFELRNIIHKAKKENQPVIKEDIHVQINEVPQNISIEAIPLPNLAEPHYLILFHKKLFPGSSKQPAYNSTLAAKGKNDEKDLRIKQLEQELAQVREDMRSITEDQETVNEELQSANEELLSSSEELQSLNEEMETSKEELQSINEELTVVNQEMIGLNEQITEARNYAEAIVATVHEPLLVLNKNMRIKSANEAFYKTFQVSERDTANKSIYELGNKQWDIPALRNMLEDILPHKTNFEHFEVMHGFPNIGERVMLLNAREMTRDKEEEKLILLAIEDVTEAKEIEKVLIKNTVRFRQLVKDLPAAVHSCDPTGLITFYNEAAVRLWGRHPVIGKDRWCGYYKMFKQDGSPVTLEDSPIEKAFRAGHLIPTEELVIERPDGTRSVVLEYPQPEFGLSGEITGAINMAFDVTAQVFARKKMEESEAHFRKMADLMPAKISNANANGDVTYFNQQWLDYAGMSFKELKDFGYHKIMHPDELAEFQERFQKAAETGTDLEMEMRFLNKKGEYKWHLNIASPVKDENGNIKMWVGATTEIQKIKEDEKLKGDFIKMVSHELKTPVTSIKGYVQLLLMMIEDKHLIKDPVQLKESLTRIDKQVVKLTRLIAEMLDLSRIETDRLELQSELFSINDLVEETIEDMRYTTAKHLITIHQDFRCNIKGDKGRIEQVIINFIANAVKYSPGSTQIEVWVQKVNQGQVAVSVQDFGIGIDNEDHQKIFERFYRVGGTSEQTYPGFGIGLFIAKEIIERQGGFITIKSEKGKGAVFTFVLPVAPENNI